MKQVKPKKNLGQHFLTDLNIAKRIADTVDAAPGLPVLEIGPGMGVLTQYLVEKGRPVKAVEIDRESVDYLRAHFPGLRDNIIGEDFLRMDLSGVFDGAPFVLTGNYPYDISSQIFFKMLDNKDLIPCCTGMIQREVALRMASQPGSKAYGILSVLIQAWYDVEYLFTVDENVFNPPPKVKSAVIRMTRNATTDIGCDETLFKRVVKTVFNQRRKMLRGSLKQLFTKETMPPAEWFAQDTMTRRPEQLSVGEFVELTNMVTAAMSGRSGQGQKAGESKGTSESIGGDTPDYRLLAAQLKGLAESAPTATALLANASAAIHDADPERFFWVGFYLVDGEQLVLGPFQGPVACGRISYGKGVCGTAWQRGETIVVPDVELFPGHIACSSLSRSEIVVPIKDKAGRVKGVIDIDSSQPDAFNEADKVGLEQISMLLQEYLP